MSAGTLHERDAALARGDELWERLRSALDRHLHEPLGPGTDWTGHDVYAHFARWQAHAHGEITRLLHGQALQPVPGDENAINEAWRAEDRELPTEDVQGRCLSTREALRSLLASLTAEQWRSVGGTLSAQDVSGEHYTAHLAQCATGDTR
jgi:hypothetical protein